MLQYVICLASGALTALPLIFENLWWMSWFSMAPFFVILMSGKPKYRHGLVFSLGFYGVVYHWFTSFYPMDFLGLDKGTSVVAIAVCWIGLSLIQAVPTALVALIFKYARGKHEWTNPFILACGWTVMEYVQELTWAGVPLCRVEISQTGSLSSIQSASLFGPMFIAFLIALVNGFLALAFVRGRERMSGPEGLKKFRLNAFALIAAGIFTANYVFGLVTVLTYSGSDRTGSISVTVIQGNLDYTDVSRHISAASAADICLELTDKALSEQRTDFVLWSEGTVNADIEKSGPIKEKISAMAEKYGVNIVVGAFESGDEKDGGGLYNSLVLFTPDGEISDEVYRKQKLVPFGEYLPMRDFIQTFLPVLAEFNSLDEDMASGSESSVIHTDYGRIGGIICFDSIYEKLSLGSAVNGAEVIFLSTNDSWFKESAALDIHRRHSVLRAVETGKYVIRSAATGVSCVVSPLGAVEQRLEVHKEGYIRAEVMLNDRRTVYSVVGNAIVVFSALTVAAFAVCNAAEAVKRRRRELPATKEK